MTVYCIYFLIIKLEESNLPHFASYLWHTASVTVTKPRRCGSHCGRHGVLALVGVWTTNVHDRKWPPIPREATPLSRLIVVRPLFLLQLWKGSQKLSFKHPRHREKNVHTQATYIGETFYIYITFITFYNSLSFMFGIL